MKNLRVAIDPGHGGNDPGALGFYPDYNEADINLELAQIAAETLRDMGASVKLVNDGSTMGLYERVENAHSFDADIFVSIHCNSSASNSSAKGTEVYYFYGNGSTLASSLSSSVAKALGTENRGAKKGAYVVTSDSAFASVLIETGFVSNKTEYKKLIKSSYQNDIGEAVADGIYNYVSSISTGKKATDDVLTTGFDDGSSESSENNENNDEDSSDQSEETDNVIERITVEDSDIYLDEGDTYTLEVNIRPDEPDLMEYISFVSSDEDVVTVDEDGEITAVSEGEAVITIRVDDKDELSISVNITVSS